MKDIDQKNKVNYFREIDGLRGIAVIAVVINHFNSSLLQSGYLGVDIFFVISGYVITASLENKDFQHFREFFLTFLDRRIKRLIPSLLVLFLVCSIATLFFVPNCGYILKTGIYSLFGISNFYLFSQSIDYFGQSSELNVFTHTWSLAVEKQFYLIFPFIFWFSGYGNSKNNGKKIFIFILILISILSFISFNYFYQKNFSASYFLLPFRFWEIAFGCLIFLKKPNILNINSSLLLLILFSVLFLPQNYGQFATPFIVILVVLILQNIKNNNKENRILTNTILVKFGLLSYSIYLWHWPIISLCKWTFNQSKILIIAQLLMILVFSLLNRSYIENLFRDRNVFRNKIVNIFLYFISSLLISFFVSIIYLFNNFPKLYNSISKGNISVASLEKCMDLDPELCLKKMNNYPSLYALGDSHMANFVPSLREANLDIKYNFLFWGGPSHIRDIFTKNCQINDCYKKDISNLKKILENNRFNENDILLYSLSRNRLYANKESLDYYDYGIKDRTNKENKAGIQLLKKAIYELIIFASEEKGGKVILIDDIPLACNSNDWIKAHSFFVKDKCKISQEESLLDRKPLTNILLEMSNKNKNVYYIDPHNVICPEKICPIIFDKKPLYTDNSPHISIENKFIFKGFFEKEINTIIKTK